MPRDEEETTTRVPPGLPQALSRARLVVGEDLSAAVVTALEEVTGRRAERDPGPDDGEPLVFVGSRLPAGLPDDRLLWAHSTNAGVDALLVGVRWPSTALLTRTVGRMGERIAQYVLGWVLAECQHVPAFLDQHRDRVWRRLPGELVRGQTAVVFGVGAIGAEIGRALGACGIRTVGVAVRAREVAGFDEVVAAGQAAGILPAARWVVSALPLTPATEGFFDAERFAAMAGATFIDVGRGATVELPALAAALADGRVRAAVLDVLADEPAGPDARCWTLPRTVVTSHSSGVTADEDVIGDFTACWQALRSGSLPRLTVRTDRGY